MSQAQSAKLKDQSYRIKGKTELKYRAYQFSFKLYTLRFDFCAFMLLS